MNSIYIAGPMTGLKDYNAEAFDKAERMLEKDWLVYNPARTQQSIAIQSGKVEPTIENIKKCFRADMDIICCDVDAIYMLKGWESSKGATAEYYLAIALGLIMKFEGNPI